MSGFYTSVERYGANILCRGYENGKSFSKKVKFTPTLYVPSKEPSDYVSFIGDKSLVPKTFDSMNEAKDYIEKYKDVHGFEIYGTSNFVTQYIQQNYPGKIKFDTHLINRLSFDIEVDISSGFGNTETADKPITSISMKFSKNSTYKLLGLKDYDKTKTIIEGLDPDDIQFEKFDTEEALLKRFIQIWTYEYPDVVTGWNVEYFDIQYIVTRIIRVLGEEKAKSLSPWGVIRKKSKELFNRVQSSYELYGITVIDFMDAFKKFGYKYGPQESYKLDHIAHVVLGEKKIDYSEYGSLTELYEQNPQLYLDYSLKDTYLIQRMEEETALIELVMTVAYGGCSNYAGAFGTVAIWEAQIYKLLLEKNIVPPISKQEHSGFGELMGGFVKDPKVGLYKYVVTLDLDSLYPHLMMQSNMSPETYINDHREDTSIQMFLERKYKNETKYAVAANGVCFTKEKLGIIPAVIFEMYKERKAVKTEMLQTESQYEKETDKQKIKELKAHISQLHNKQMSIKIFLNSLYGAIANKHFLYYIPEVAEAITSSGQLAIQWAGNVVNEYLNRVLKTDNFDYIIYIDTDSLHVNMSPLAEKVLGESPSREQVESFFDKVFKEKIEGVIKTAYEELADRMGAYRNAMSMKREKICEKAIYTGAKHYIMSTLNSEGVHYDEPKISVTGIESVRSSTPEVCREKMRDMFKVLLNETETDVQKFISDFKQEFYSLSANEVGKNSGTDDIEKYIDKNTGFKKGCPIHVRGCILYNDFLKEKNIVNKYPPIISGDKVKFVYLKLPNPLRQNVISFVDRLPKEFELDNYIDYETQFEKVFLKPMKAITQAVGWNIEHVDTLESFFN